MHEEWQYFLGSDRASICTPLDIHSDQYHVYLVTLVDFLTGIWAIDLTTTISVIGNYSNMVSAIGSFAMVSFWKDLGFTGVYKTCCLHWTLC